MNRVPLLEVAPLVSERVEAFEGTRPYVATGDADDIGRLTSTPVLFESRPTRADLRAKAGDVVFARMASTRKVFLVDAANQHSIFSTGFAVIRPQMGILDPLYLRHWLQTDSFQASKDSHSSGATQRAITNAGISKMSIPLPPLAEQRRIASILDQAESLHTQCLQRLAQLNDLSKAIFLDMFGDPLLNTHDLPTRSLGTVASIMTGNTPSRAVASNYGSDIEWVKSDNLGFIIASAAHERLSPAGKSGARIAPAGSILVTCIAGSPNSIGKASLVDREVAFNQQINAIVPGSDVLSRFILEQLRVSPDLVRMKSTGGMKGLVNKSAFSAINIIVPRMQHQREFEERMTKIDQLAAHSRHSAESYVRLIGALRKRAFLECSAFFEAEWDLIKEPS